MAIRTHPSKAATYLKNHNDITPPRGKRHAGEEREKENVEVGLQKICSVWPSVQGQGPSNRNRAPFARCARCSYGFKFVEFTQVL